MTGLIVRIDLGPHGRLGPGKLLLLEHISRLGSISAAGRAMNMSYRQAWSLVDQLNHAFKEPVVVSQTGGKSGGGASVTEFGKLLLVHCSAIISNAKRTSGPHLEFIEAVLRPAEASGRPAEASERPDDESAPSAEVKRRPALERSAAVAGAKTHDLNLGSKLTAKPVSKRAGKKR